MTHTRGTDTSSIAVSAALTGGAVIGGMKVASDTFAEIGNDYAEHIRAGGQHIPEMLLLPFLLVVGSLGWIIFADAQDIAALGHVKPLQSIPGAMGYLLDVIGVVAWLAVPGGIAWLVVGLGEGAVLNAIIPVAVAGVLAYGFGNLDGKSVFFCFLGVWFVTRILVALLTRVRVYRVARLVFMQCFCLALVTLPILLHFGWPSSLIDLISHRHA